MTTTYRSLYKSTLGWLNIEANNKGITRVEFFDENPLPDQHENILTQTAKRQLEEYFTGHRTQFELPLAPKGTDFQHRCWQALQAIPYGETRSYADQALAIQKPNAVRAVGTANGANPLSIVVPCHRVIGKSGKLTGYAGGLDRKENLLKWEKLNAKGD